MASRYTDLINSEPAGDAEVKGKYTDLINEDAEGGAFEVRRNARENAEKSPERHVEVLKYSKDMNLPRAFVDRNLDTIKKEKKIKDFDYNKLSQENPKVADWFRNPDNMALAHDDLEGVKNVSNKASNLKFTKEGTFLKDLGHGLKINNASMEKALIMARAMNGLGDIDELSAEYVNKENQIQKLSEYQPEYLKNFQQEYAKESPELQGQWAKIKHGAEMAWDGEIIKGLKEFGEGALNTPGEFFDVISTLAKNPKALAYSGVQSISASFAPMIAGFGGAFAGGSAGATVGSLGGIHGVALGATVGTGAGYFAASTAAGTAIQYHMEMDKYLKDQGVDTTDPVKFAAALRNPAVMAMAKEKAMAKSLTNSTIETLTDMLGGKLIKSAKPGVISKVGAAVKGQAMEAIGETLGEFGGTVAAEGYEEANFPDAMMEGATSVITGTGIGGLTYAVATGSKMRSELSENTTVAAVELAQQADEAKGSILNYQNIEELSEAVNNSQLKGRDHDAMIDLVNQSNDGAPVYFQNNDWDDHWTALGENPAEKAEELLPGGRAEYEAAKAEGRPLEIPLGDYIVKMGDEESFSELNKKLAKSPDGMNFNEANRVNQEIGSTLKELAEEAKIEEQKLKDFNESRKAVEFEVENQFRAAGMDVKEAKNLGAVYGAQTSALAKISGITPLEFFQKRRLEVTSPGMGVITENTKTRLIENIGQDEYNKLAEELGEFTESDAKRFMGLKAASIRKAAKAKTEIKKVKKKPAPKQTKKKVRARDKITPAKPVVKEYKDLDKTSKELADELIDTEIERMIYQIEGAQGSIKGRGIIEQDAQGQDVAIPLNQQSTFPKWYADIKAKNKEDFKKAALSKKGAKYERIKSAAIEVLKYGDETVDERVMPDNDFRSLLNMEPDEDFDLFQKDALGFIIKDGEKTQTETTMPEVVTATQMTKASKAKSFRGTPAKLKTQMAAVLADQNLTNAHNGKTYKVTGKSLNDLVDNVYQAAEQMEKKNRPKAAIAFEGSITAIKHLPLLIQNAVHVATDKDGNDILYAVGEYEGKKITAKIGTDGTDINELAVFVEKPQAPVDPALTGGDGQTAQGEISLTEFKDRVNAGRNALRLFQDDGKKRGAIDVSSAEKMVIALFHDKDRSTAIHEMGHAFLENLKTAQTLINESNELNETQRQLAKDIDTLLEDFGLNSLDDVQVEHHEKFARMTEAYFMEGKAPSEKLRSIFNTYKTWLVNIYKNIMGISRAAGQDIKLNDELRGVFDRLLATEDEIAEANGDMGYSKEEYISMFEKIGIKNTEKNDALDELLEAQNEARAEAELILYRKNLKQEMAKKTKEYNKVKKEVKKNVTRYADTLPVYVMMDDISNHTLGGEKILGVNTVKIRTSELKEILSPEDFKRFPKRLYAADGVSASITADIMGQGSGKELIDLILKTPSKKMFIEATIKEQMNTFFPDFMNEGMQNELKTEAINSVHNDKQGRVLKLELDLLFKHSPAKIKEVIRRTVNKIPATQKIKKEAARRIADTKLKEIRPALFMRMENKSRKEAGAFLTKGDFEKSIASKMKEIFNHQLYRAALDESAQVEKRINKAKSRLNKIDKKLAQTGQIDMLKAAQSLMSKFGMITEVQTEKLDKYLDLLKNYDSDAYAKVTALTEGLVNIEAKEHKELTLNEFKEVMDVVEALYSIARAEKTIMVDGKRVDKETAINDMIGNIDHVSDDTIKKTDTWFKKGMSFLLSADARLTRMEHLLNYYDKADVAGPFKKYIWNRAQDSQLKYENLLEEKQTQLNNIFKEKFGGILSSPEKIDISKYFGGTGDDSYLSRSELVMALIHSGNESNKRKLLVGRGWGGIDFNGDLDSKKFDAFITDMIDQGKITKDIMDGVQAIWDLFEEMKPGLQKTHKEVMGYFFEEIEADEIKTPWGTYRGGYAPAVTDPLRVSAQANRENKLSVEMEENIFMMPGTPKGMTLSRVQAYNEALSLELRVLRSHVEKVSRFTELQGAVTDINKFMNDKNFTNAIESKNKYIINEGFRPWLAALATQQTSRPSESGSGRLVSRYLSKLRSNANQQLMFANTVNTLENVLEMSVVFKEVKPKSYGESMRRYQADHKKVTDQITGLSAFMKNRLEGQIFEIADTYEELMTDENTVIGKYQNFQRNVKRHTYVLQHTVQNVLDIATWGAAFDEKLGETGDTDLAVRHADSVISRIMGSNKPIDLARIESGEILQKIVLTFYSYFLNKGNLARYSQKGERLRGFTYAIAMPAILSALFRKSLRGGLDEDEDDNYMDDVAEILILAPILNTVAAVPGGAMASRYIQGQFTDATYDDRLSISPMVSMIESGRGVKNILTKDEIKGRDIRDALNFAGTLTGLPLGAFGRPMGFIMDLEEGKQRAENPADYAQGLLTGRSGKK